MALPGSRPETAAVDIATLEAARARAASLTQSLVSGTASIGEQLEHVDLLRVIDASVRGLDGAGGAALDFDEAGEELLVFDVRSLDDVVAVIDKSFPGNRTTEQWVLEVVVGALRGALVNRAAAPSFVSQSSFDTLRGVDGSRHVYTLVLPGPERCSSTAAARAIRASPRRARCCTTAR
mmetsp:Transcript_33319/g.116781  ORF Transcript_33319/g.116781 Transcript_33319/m.116781 type:complete len:179 (-) Transcript_33319:16-552(-)